MLENGYIFFLRFNLPSGPHVSAENGHRKLIFSQTLSRVEIFENAGFSFSCGLTKMKVSNAMMSYTKNTSFKYIVA